MYAVCRSAKHSDSGSLGAASQHATRERETPNADPSRLHLNRVIHGAADPAAEIERRIAELQARGVKIRKNGVRAIELVLSASPEFFSKYPERKEAFYSQSVGWLKSYFGEKNLASVIAHEDESTPHLSVFVLPLDESPRKKGPQIRLNAARWMDGRERLAKMQTSFAQAMAPLGLDRGVERSRARHQDVSRFYGVLQRCKALTGIDDDIKAVEVVIANKKGELEHLRQKQKDLERLIMQIDIDNKKRKQISIDVEKSILADFSRQIIAEGQKIAGRIGPVVSFRGAHYHGVVQPDGNITYVWAMKGTETLVGKDMEVSCVNDKLSFRELTLHKVIEKQEIQKPEKKDIKGPTMGGMSL